MKRVLAGLAVLVAAVAVVALVRAARVGPAPKAPAAADLIRVDAGAAAGRLAGALRITTVTHQERGRVDGLQFPVLHDYLARQFPQVHRRLAREIVARYSLLYTWPGTDPAAAPILLLAHQDVVPIEPGAGSRWAQPPFGGVIADGYVWGRGALDDKGSLVAQLEAVELLLKSGFAPRRTVYFAFGHDEEIGGEEGAVAIAALLQARGVKAEFSLDEGGFITTGIVAGVAAPVASIMTAEKGYVTLALVARDEGGHSSRPPRVSAIGRLARAVARLERQPPPARLTPPVAEMLDRLASGMAFGARLASANRWLFEPLIVRAMTAASVTNALVRTTTAPTIFQAGIKENIMPVEARAIVNFRILPGESIAAVEAHVRATVDDAAVTVTRGPFASEPSPVSGTGTPAFGLLERTVNEVFPEALVAPGLVIGVTDNRHYGAVREARYNFLPVTLGATDVARMHGIDERVAVEDHARAVQFYAQLLRNAAGP